MALEPDIQTEGQAPPVQPVTPPAPPMPMGEEEGELHDIGEMDFEFLTAGDPAVAPQDAVNRMMENLTPEEQSEIAGLVPYVERFFILQFKAETGEYPPEPEVEPEGGGGVTIDEYRAMSPEEQIANSMQGEVGSPVLKPRSSFDRSPSQISEAVLEPEMAQASVQENIEPAMQKGGITPKQQVREDIPQGKPVPAGPVGEVAVEGKDESGVADDVKTKSDGFVLSKGAVIANGKMYIMDLINDAIESLRKKGKIADTEQIPESAEDILVSNGEFVIPDIIAQEIGYKRLEKMNKRGAELTEQLIAEHEPKQGQQQQAALIPGFQKGNSVKNPPLVPGGKPNPSQGPVEDYGGLDFRALSGHLGEGEYDPNVVSELEQTMGVGKEYVDDFGNMDNVHNQVDKLLGTFGYPPELVRKAIYIKEWKNLTPSYSFVRGGFGKIAGAYSTAFGPGQLVSETLKDVLDNNRLAEEDRPLAETILASQALFANLRNSKRGKAIVDPAWAADQDQSKKALKVLGITKEEFIDYYNDGYWKPHDQDVQGIPKRLLGNNFEQHYNNLVDTIFLFKSKRNTVKKAEGNDNKLIATLAAYHGSGNEKVDNKYANDVKKILDDLIRSQTSE